MNSTGKDKSVKEDGRVIGQIKTLVYHTTRKVSDKKKRSKWMMKEYRCEDKGLADKRYVCVKY